jgi:3-deoxy-D-manno-octulosonic-acid transferase
MNPLRLTILIFYNLALSAVLLSGSPWWLFRLITTQKYREGFWARLGRCGPLKGVNGRPLIWIHAVSVGEVLAVSRLVKTLDAVLPEYFVAISTTTQTGQKLARERFGSNRVFYAPLDLPWATSNWLEFLKPRMMILAETEFWPNWLHGCFRRDIPVVVVNARISDRSWPRYRRLRGLWKPFLSKLTAVLAQSGMDADRLKAIGCRQDAVSVAGNLKFDVRAAWDAEATTLLTEKSAGLRFIVAGSTLDGEEQQILSAWPALLRVDPNLAMVIAPRHSERFSYVADLVSESGYPNRRRSAIGQKNLLPGEVILLDSIGELASVYSLASVAFVGGSLVPAGGHNPLEPAQFGVPTLIGEHYANFTAIVDALRDAGAIVIVKPTELEGVLIELIADRARATEIGKRAQDTFEKEAGATVRAVAEIRKVLENGKSFRTSASDSNGGLA